MMTNTVGSETASSWMAQEPAKTKGQLAYERKKARDLAFRAEVEELRRKKAERDAAATEASRIRNLPRNTLSKELLDLIRSDGFKHWYETVVGKDHAQFVADHPEERANHSFSFGTYNRVVIDHIRRLFHANKWQSPAYKKHWCARIHTCTDPVKRRQIIMRLATPEWADGYEIAKIYRERDRIVAKTGVPHDVDHIIPLQGVLVCGLHVHYNLRVMDASLNRSKSNRYVIE
ncbi:hypothetical protein [Cupriavidus taiwanensis]|uniref:hypothetical protein n=1 Tax=Cupriavidus taiwanensis TaxID=164546 RepID=UPI000E17AF82|nr:hypothetical protein [Cupriavidus taiwanensis]SPA44614.1 conserved hypothetical protein [Cupriavidus taiwanensis]